MHALTIVLEDLDTGAGQTTAEDERGVIQFVTEDQTTLQTRAENERGVIQLITEDQTTLQTTAEDERGVIQLVTEDQACTLHQREPDNIISR